MDFGPTPAVSGAGATAIHEGVGPMSIALRRHLAPRVRIGELDQRPIAGTLPVWENETFRPEHRWRDREASGAEWTRGNARHEEREEDNE